MTTAVIGRAGQEAALALPGKIMIGAEIWMPGQAEFTGVAGDIRVHRHAQTIHRAAFDHATKFMPQHKRLADSRFACAPIGVPVDIGTTNPHSFDAHQGFIKLNLRLGFFVNAEITNRVNA